MGGGPWGTSARTPSLSLTPPPPPPSAPCSYTRDRPLFLQLKDYFWVRTPSLYELPYGIKGSGEPPPPRARGGRLSVCLSVGVCFPICGPYKSGGAFNGSPGVERGGLAAMWGWGGHCCAAGAVVTFPSLLLCRGCPPAPAVGHQLLTA